MAEKISLVGLDKAAVLAALYRAARPQGMGCLHYNPKPMTIEEAHDLIAERSQDLYFDYLDGRVMKVDLSGDELDHYSYDLDNGAGKAAMVIGQLRKDPCDVNTKSIQDAHLSGVREGAEASCAGMEQKQEQAMIEIDGVQAFLLPISFYNVKDKLAPVIKGFWRKCREMYLG